MKESQYMIEHVDADGVLTIVINRSDKRNALSSTVQEQLKAVLADYSADPAIKLVILGGAGDRAFAAGGDLDELDAIRTFDAAHAMAESGKRTLDAVRNFPAPVVARLNGVALGGGAELACACDMRYAAKHARIGFVQANLAITTAWGGSYDLFRTVGAAQALQLLTQGEVISAGEAFRIGLVNGYTCEQEDEETAFRKFIAPMRNKTASVLRSYKKLRLLADQQARAEWNALESELLASSWVSEEHWNAVRSIRADKE